ncbi:MAG: hypothetical protein Q8P75_00475 [bacterium]|nr:hypothetical protein [bacterium]
MRKFELEAEIINNIVPRESGIYFIHADFQFPRLKGKTDILYIGTSKSNLRKRLGTFIRGFKMIDKLLKRYDWEEAIKKFQGSRKATPRSWRLSRQLKRQLYFTYEICEDCRTRENELLYEFEKKHFELPPLNHAN